MPKDSSEDVLTPVRLETLLGLNCPVYMLSKSLWAGLAHRPYSLSVDHEMFNVGA